MSSTPETAPLYSTLARQPVSAAIVLGLSLCALSMTACGNRTGVLRTGPHQPDREAAPLRVRTMPPPVRVEAIPLRRNNQCYYRDGAWVPEGSTWRWEKGEWLLPPAGCYYAPPRTAYEQFGVGTALVHRPGVWHPKSAAKNECGQPKKCLASQGD